MIKFTNVHYYPAAATLYASRADGGYQYPGQTYDARFRHVPGYDTCIGCHDQHSTKVKFDECSQCHQGVKDVEGARKIRMMSSATRDYDGDGDLTEGIHGELDGLRTKLLAAITGYGKEKKTPVCYDTNSLPVLVHRQRRRRHLQQRTRPRRPTAFASWTARLAKAAFNYQLSIKDPGNFAHNAKYVMELLYDSITDVNVALAAKVDMSKATRTDFGHFNGASEAARHWDANDKVDATCSRCHSGLVGVPLLPEVRRLDRGARQRQRPRLRHLPRELRHRVQGAGGRPDHLPERRRGQAPRQRQPLLELPRGREAKATIDAALKTAPRFLNVHYLPAGSTKLGVQAHLGYEYDGATYAGPLAHTGGTQCTSCHDPVATKHTFLIEDAFEARCKTCHADANGNPKAIRNKHKLDYDGDGNVTEPLADEIAGMGTKLLAAMQAKAGPTGLCYGPGAYPYFFKDSDMDGKPFCSTAEAVSANAFAAWTAELVKAAHNFQISRVEPGAWAHNFDYMAELLFDSTVALKGDGAGMTRP
jgi:predicted CXXCH cytochrome family protein